VGGSLNKRHQAAIFLVVLVDLIGFALIIPLLPYYAKQYQASDFVVGLLLTSYSAMSIVGAPVLGRLSDRWGRRPILVVSIFGTFLGFLLLGFANSFWLLFASRILDGITGGNFSVAQAYVTDVTDESSRAKGMGMIGAAFGLGFIIGPALGGTLSLLGYGVPAFFAAGLALANLVLVLAVLPESLTAERRRQLGSMRKSSGGWEGFRAMLRRPRVGSLLQVRFLFGLSFGVFESIFPLYAQSAMGLTAHTTSFLLVYMGVILVAVQGGAIGRLAARFSEAQLILGSFLLLTVALIGWAVSPSLVWILAVLAPMSVASGVLNTVIRSALSKSVSHEEVGGILGAGASLGSVTRVLAPVVGGFLLGEFGASAPGLFSAVLSAWLVVYTWRALIRKAGGDRAAEREPSLSPAASVPAPLAGGVRAHDDD